MSESMSESTSTFDGQLPKHSGLGLGLGIGLGLGLGFGPRSSLEITNHNESPSITLNHHLKIDHA